MATRVITGSVYNLLNQPVQNAKIKFTLNTSACTTDREYNRSSVEVITDSSGNWSVNLWCNSESLSPTNYTCVDTDGSRFIFTLEPGSIPLTFTQIKVLGVPIGVADVSLKKYIDQQLVSIVANAGNSLQNIFLPFADDQTIYTLSFLPIAPQNTMLFINGVKYEYLQDYTLSGYLLTWLNFFNLKSNYRIQLFY